MVQDPHNTQALKFTRMRCLQTVTQTLMPACEVPAAQPNRGSVHLCPQTGSFGEVGVIVIVMTDHFHITQQYGISFWLSIDPDSKPELMCFIEPLPHSFSSEWVVSSCQSCEASTLTISACNQCTAIRSYVAFTLEDHCLP